MRAIPPWTSAPIACPSARSKTGLTQHSLRNHTASETVFFYFLIIVVGVIRLCPCAADNGTWSRWDAPSYNGTKKAAVHHPRWGGDGGLRLRRGLRHLPMALWTIGDFAPCAARPGTLPPGNRDFGLPAVRWQKWSARNFASGQGAALPPYWMYGKKPHRRHGGKGPASTADTRTVGGPHKKKSSKTFYQLLFFSRPYLISHNF